MAATKEQIKAEGVEAPPAGQAEGMVVPQNQDVQTPDGAAAQLPAQVEESAKPTGHPVADLIQGFLGSLQATSGMTTIVSKDDGTTRILKVMDGSQAYWVTIYRQKPKG